VGAVTRSSLGAVREMPETRSLLVRAMGEVRNVALACGVPLRADIVERTMAFLDGMAAEATTSTQRDLIEGRPSELEALNGAVVRLGREAGVPTPVNEFLYASLLPWERRARITA
jgi:2-dehydropantoate 2-reductase